MSLRRFSIIVVAVAATVAVGLFVVNISSGEQKITEGLEHQYGVGIRNFSAR